MKHLSERIKRRTVVIMTTARISIIYLTRKNLASFKTHIQPFNRMR